jgi:phosphoglucosamine mutase
MANNQYFGTDGIRGTVGTPPMTAEFVYRLGVAVGHVLSLETPGPDLFVIGRDTRTSGPLLQDALTRGLLTSGARVVDLGILPTPGIAWLTRELAATAGAIISASHNPAAENGIKFLNPQGMKLSESQEAAIEAYLMSLPEGDLDLPETGLREDGTQNYDLYLQDLVATQKDLDLSGLKILLDCSNGAAYRVGPELFGALGAEVVSLNTESDGVNINVHAGSEYARSKPEALAALLTEHQASLAITFDGDADRVILMDETGQLIDGDHMLAILADALHQEKRLLANSLVTTVMANGSLHQFAAEHHFELIQTPVGDKYVSDVLLGLTAEHNSEGKLGLGGEQSGHIILLDENHRTGDGLRTAVFMLQVLLQQEQPSMAALASRIQKYPQMVASCNVANKLDLKTMGPLQAKLDEIKQRLPGLVQLNSRYSGTEPKYRLMIETDTRHSTQELAVICWEVCDLIQRETGTPPGAKIEVLNVSAGGLVPRPETEN